MAIERKYRILTWILYMIIVIILGNLSSCINNNFIKEKKAITVYAPEDMEESFKVALKVAGLKKDYKIKMTDKLNSDICVDYAKQNDKSYTKFAFSPFIIAYSDNDDYCEDLEKSKVLVESEYNKDYLDIDFLKIINEVLGEGKWSNLGIKDLKNIKIYYPSKETPYWNDFYDFMLVTVNNGKYPIEYEERKNADETIQKFLNADTTESITNFNEQIKRTGGFTDNVFYVIPEKTAVDLRKSNSSKSLYVRFLYPINTVYFNYYIKGNELGNKIIDKLETEDFFGATFYDYLDDEYYRSTTNSELMNISDCIEGERDVYNVINIDKSKEISN